MDPTGTVTKQYELPQSATITIRKQTPSPDGKVEVAPWTGRVHFENKDNVEYRLRFYKPNTEPLAGIDILLPASGSVAVLIKQDDAFFYSVLDVGDRAATGKGGGPIIN